MNFVFPAFLWALGLIAIPIIIHLFQFRRYKTVFFTNVKFLKEVKEETTSRYRLKHLLVLLSRILAVIFLVLAFAQPFIPTGDNAVDNTTDRAVSVYIDNSFSMSAETEEEPLLARAKRKAEEIVKAYGEADRFQLLTNDMEGKHQRMVGKEEFLAFLDDVKLTSTTRSLKEIQALQQQNMSTAGIENRVFYWISDYQRSMVDMEIDTLAITYLVPLQPQQQDNVFIDSTWLEKPLVYTGQPNRLLVKVRNTGETNIESNRLTLNIGGQTKAIADVSVAPKAFTIDTVTFTVSKSGWQQLELNLSDHPIVFDDNYYMAVNAIDKVDVQVIFQEELSPYLKALYASSEKFELSSQKIDQLNYSGLGNNAMIVLDNVASIPSGLTFELQQFVEQGGVVALFPGAKMDVGSYNAFAAKLGLDRIAGLADEEERVRRLDDKQPIFEDVFESVPRNIDLPKANLHFTFQRSTNSSGQVILAFRDGSPFVAEYPYGNGKVYLCASPLDKEYTDLPVHALFVPLMYKMALSGGTYSKPAFTLGVDDIIEVKQATANAEEVVRITGKELEFIPEQRRVGSKMQVSIGKQFERSGHYQVVDDKGAVMQQLALNYNRAESVLEYFSAEELTNTFASENLRVLDVLKADLGAKVKELDKGIVLWKLCLIFALLFLAIEVLLLRFWP